MNTYYYLFLLLFNIYIYDFRVFYIFLKNIYIFKLNILIFLLKNKKNFFNVFNCLLKY